MRNHYHNHHLPSAHQTHQRAYHKTIPFDKHEHSNHAINCTRSQIAIRRAILNLLTISNSLISTDRKRLTMENLGANNTRQRTQLKGILLQSFIGKPVVLARRTLGKPSRTENVNAAIKALHFQSGIASITVFVVADRIVRIRMSETYGSLTMASTSFLLNQQALLIAGYTAIDGTETSKAFVKDEVIASLVFVRSGQNYYIITDFVRSREKDLKN